MSIKKSPSVYLPDIHFKKDDSIDHHIPIGMSKDCVQEINFHSKLNSLCLSGDITFTDTNNNFLNFINEQDVICELTIYKCLVNDNNDIDQGPIFLKYSFYVSKIDIISFKSNSSLIKVHLQDKLQSLAFEKLIHFSNYDIPYDKIDVAEDIRIILNPLKTSNGSEIVIPDNVFGENIENYRCRFTSSNDETVEEAMIHYLENMYEKSYDESVLTPKFNKDRKIPDRLVAFAPHFVIDKDGGVIKPIPRLTSAIEIVDEKEIDVPESTFEFASKKINGIIEGLVEQLNVEVAFSKIISAKDIKDLIPIAYRTNWLNKTTGGYDKDDLYPDESPIFINNYDKIESDFEEPFLGEGEDPDFKIKKIFQNKSESEKYLFTTEFRYYGDNSERTLYQDMAKVMLYPYVYVTCPGSAMHSPGQVVDLRYVRVNPKMTYKKLNETYNKLFSGKWKVINSTTRFSSDVKPGCGLVFQEILGLNRLGYFSIDKLNGQSLKLGSIENEDDNETKPARNMLLYL